MNGFVESVQMMIIFYETYIAAQQELGKITFDLCWYDMWKIKKNFEETIIVT